MLESDKLTLLQPHNSPFLSIPSIVFTGSLLVSVKRASLFGDEMRMQTWRRTELLQMLRVTTIGSHSHVGSQSLGKDLHRLDVFSWQLFPNGLQSDFQRFSTHQLSYASAEVYGTFAAWCPRCDSPVGSNLESLRATQSSQ